MALRILVVARWYPSHDVAGRGIFVADQVAALVAAGAQVAVLCPDPVYVEGLEGPDRGARLAAVSRWAAEIGSRLAFAAPAGRGAPGVPVLRIPGLLPAGGQASRDPLELAALEAIVLVPIGRALHAAWPFDVIHAHTGMPDGLAAAQLADSVGVRLLTTEHDSSTPGRLSDPTVAEAYRGLLRPGRGLVTVSRALASRIEERAGLEPGRISVVPNVVTLESFAVADGGARQPGELLWVGARKESKGTGTLLAAFAMVHAARPATRLRMIGRAATDTEDQRLRAIATGLGIASSVTFEPATDRAGVAAAMARAALFVHPSPWETFGIVAAEALAMGLPVVATPSGGVEEILGSDGRLGVIAASHDPRDLASAILATLDSLADFDPAVLRAAVVERFAPAIVARKLLAVMEALGATEPPGLEPPGLEPLLMHRRGWSSQPVVVVGFRRSSALARIAAAPTSLVDRLTLVTTAAIKPSTGQPTGEAKAPIGVSGWGEADIG
ncbi:MAG: glycosyltransferase, partial [Gemmatimonadales bacterium]